MLYFARMLDKIHKHARGELRDDFLENLGGGLDKRCADYLRVPYADIAKRTLDGGSPEEILEWCVTQGRALDDNDILIWNDFVTKPGWNDQVTDLLEQGKAESGLIDHNEIETMLEYFEYDEGTKISPLIDSAQTLDCQLTTDFFLLVRTLDNALKSLGKSDLKLNQLLERHLTRSRCEIA